MIKATRARKAAGDRLIVVVFELAERVCALPLRWVREVVPMPMLARPPGLPSIVEGVMNLGGTAVPVLRLDRLFAFPDQDLGLYTPLIVLRRSQAPTALLAGRVREIMSFSKKDIMAVGGDDIFNGCLEAELPNRGETIHLLSPDRILLERERARIAEFQAREQERLDGLEGEAR